MIPSAVTTTMAYDGDSRLTARDGPLTNDDLVYDAAGRVIGGTVTPASGGTLNLSIAYNGLGALAWAAGISAGLTAEDVQTDALGTKLWGRDVDMIDGVNRTRLNVADPASGQLTAMTLSTGPCGSANYFYLTSCHPAWYNYDYGQSYDPSGNVDATWETDTKGTDASSAEWVADESRSYYAADEKLTYFNRMQGWIVAPNQGIGTFDEYRYDALGRRVLTRTRQPGQCGSSPLPSCDAFIERTVYDGDQVLAEIRSSGGDTTAAGYMEAEGIAKPLDDPNLYGIILYAHAGGIDQPAHLLKRLPDGTWTSLTPHTDWRGEYAYGTLASGTTCTTSAATCPNWPGFAVSAYGKDQGVGPTKYDVWFGSLVRGRRDASGLTNLRNRYYDAASGRFTQQDPIGLAGGLNLYGYAGGDPINFSDPFGLCPMKLTGRPCGQPLAVRNVIRESATNPRIGEFGLVRNGGTTNHQGNDILALRGQSVRAVAVGTVSAVGHSESYGNYVELAHKNADGKVVSYSFYAHLDRASSLAEGESVFAGKSVGEAGNSGNANGTPTHVHLEIRTQSMPGRGLTGRRDPQPDVKLDNRP